jgi:hypothetical protein
VVARHDPGLFAQLIRFARQRYPSDKATYHVSARLEDLPDPQSVSDPRQLERWYLGHWDDVPPGEGFTNPGRQVLHCTFGSVLTDPHWGPQLQGLLRSHQETYTEVLQDHFVRHLRALQV